MSEILRQYRAMAASGQHFRGLTLLHHAPLIHELIQNHNATTLLDYGAGAGDAYEKPHQVHKVWGVARPRLYDPAFKHDNKPGKGDTFHGVIASDVLEHVPEESVGKLIGTLFRHAERFVFASVCCRPAKKLLPTGENLHCTVKPYDWWFALFEAQMAHKRAPFEFLLIETP